MNFYKFIASINYIKKKTLCVWFRKGFTLSKKTSHHARRIYWSANKNIQHEEMLLMSSDTNSLAHTKMEL